MSAKNEDRYTAELRVDQWDLIVLALEHIRQMSTNESPMYAVDRLGRMFLRRRCVETVAAIQSQIPKMPEG